MYQSADNLIDRKSHYILISISFFALEYNIREKTRPEQDKVMIANNAYMEVAE